MHRRVCRGWILRRGIRPNPGCCFFVSLDLGQIVAGPFSIFNFLDHPLDSLMANATNRRLKFW